MFLSKIGTGELILIIVIAIIVFGPDKLPKIARSIGKAFGTAKKYARQVGDELKEYEEEVEDVASTLRDPLGLKKKDSPAKPAEEPGQAFCSHCGKPMAAPGKWDMPPVQPESPASSPEAPAQPDTPPAENAPPVFKSTFGKRSG